MSSGFCFSEGQLVVYPAHGVGRVVGREDQAVGDLSIEVLVINFERDRMTIRIPASKAAKSGLRPLSSPSEMLNMLQTLTKPVRVSKAQWTRRCQEYEQKISSGDPLTIADVVRTLYRPRVEDQTYGERRIYNQALSRLVEELAAVEDIAPEAASAKIHDLLRAS